MQENDSFLQILCYVFICKSLWSTSQELAWNWRRLDLNQWGGSTSIDLQSIAFDHSATSPFL
jgi:hypothetical protein